MDMPAIQELSDDRLRELSAAKPTDLERAQAKVATLEVQFAAARAAHAKNFPRDPRATDPKCQESLQAGFPPRPVVSIGFGPSIPAAPG
jgi:hypothetical protein